MKTYTHCAPLTNTPLEGTCFSESRSLQGTDSPTRLNLQISPVRKQNPFRNWVKTAKAMAVAMLFILSVSNTLGQTATTYLQSTQIQAGTGTYVRDIALAIGSTGSVISQATGGGTNQTYTELLAFTIDINNLAFAISGNSFPVSVNVSAVSSNTNSQYQFRLQRLNSSGVLQSSTGYSTAYTGTGTRTATLSFTPAQTWVAGDRLKLSIEVRSANATTGRTITVSTGNSGSFIQYTYVATPTITSTGTGGPWSDINTWVGSVVPAAGNHVVIATGATVTADVLPASIGNLTVNGTLDAATFTLSGTGTLLVAGSGILKIGDTNNFPTGFVTNTLTGTVNYYMTADQTVAAQTYSNLTLSGSGIKTLGGTVNGILSMEGMATASGAPTYGAAATLQYNGSGVQTTGSEFPATWIGSGGVIIANTAGEVTLGGAKVINAPLTINLTATLNTDAVNNYGLTFGGNFIRNGTLTANGSSVTINGAGTQTIAGFSTTGSATITGAGTQTIANFTATAGVTISGTGTPGIGGFTTTGEVLMSKTAGTATFTGNVSGGALTLNGIGGTLNLGTALSHTFTGLWTMTAGTLNGGTSTLNIDGDTSGSTATLSPGTGTVIFNGASSQTIQPLTYNNLTSSNAGARVLSSSGTIGIAGTFIPGTNPYTITGSTINFNGGGAQTIPAFNYQNLTSSAAGARTLTSSGITGVAGIFTPGTNAYTITGSTVQFNGPSQSVPAFNYNNLDLSAATTAITLAGTGTIGIAGTFIVPVVSATITGSTINYNGSGAQTIPSFNYQNLTSSNTGGRTLASSGTIGIAGTFTPGTNAYTNTGSTLDYNGGVQTIAVITYNNLALSGSGAKSFPSGITISGDLTINPTATADLGTFNHTAASLHFGATLQTTDSSWGSTVSSATNKDANFGTTAAGILYVGNVCIPGTWTGAAGTDWNTPGNWSCPSIPDASTDVLIPGSLTNYPSIGSAAVCRNLTINGSGGSLTNTSTLTIGGNLTNNGTYTDVSGTFVLNGSSIQVISGASTTAFNNLTISGTGAKTLTTIPSVAGILSVEGIATVSASPTYGALSTLQYNTATTRVAGLEWPSTFSGTGGVLITNTGVITSNGAKILGPGVNLTINSGSSLNTGNSAFSLGGNFTAAGGTFTAGSSPILISGNSPTQSIAGYTTTGLTTMSKTAGTATFTGNVGGAGLTINGTGGTLNLGAGLTHTFTSVVALTNGTLNGGSSTLVVNALLNSWTGTGTNFVAGTGTVTFGGGAQTITAVTTFNNLIFGGTGAKTLTGVPTVNGILSMEGTGTAVTAPTYGAAATLQYNTATSRAAGPEWITPFVASGGVIIGNTGTITANAAKVFNATAPLTLNNLSNLNMSTFLLTLNGNLVNNGAASIAGSGGLTLTGTAAQSIGAFTTTGPVSMTKTGGTATLGGSLNGGSLTINGTAGTLDLGSFTHILTGAWTMTSGTLLGSSSTLNIGGNGSSAGGTFTAGSGIVDYNGAGAQTVATVIYHDLHLSTSGAKTFTAATTISNDLTINPAATADLGTFNHTAASLHFSATLQTTDSSWGSTVSSATNKDANFGTASSGLLYVGNVCIPGTWTGAAADGNWDNTANWSCPVVPDASTDVTIPASLASYPNITLTAVCRNLILNGTLTSSGTLTVGGNWTNNGTFTDVSGTVILNGSSAQVISGGVATSFYNLIVAGTGTKTLTTVPTINHFLSVEGSATVSAAPTYGVAATLQYNTATPRGATAEWVTPFAGTGGVIIGNTGTITANGAKVFNATAPLTLNSGSSLDMSTFLLTLNGNLINNGAATIAGSGGLTLTGTAAQSIGAFTTSGLVSMTKTGSSTATLSGNLNGAGLTINGATGTLNLGAGLTHTFTGAVALTSGTLNGSSSILNVNFTGSAWTGTGANFTAGTGTVVFGGVAQTITAATTFNNLTLTGTGTATKTLTGVPTVTNILSMEGTATASTAPTYLAGATLQYNTATSRAAGPEWITPFVASGGVIIGNTGTITANAAKVFNATAPLTLNNLSNLNMSTFLLTLNGNLVNNGAASIAGSGGLTLTGAAAQSIGAFTTTGTVSVTKTSGTATLTGNLNGGPLTLNGSGTLDLGSGFTHTFSGAWVRTAGTVTANSSTLNIGGTVTINGGTFNAGTGTVNFTGAAQTIANIVYNNLILSGTGAKAFPAAITINGDLTINPTAVADLAAFNHSAGTLHFGAALQVNGTWGSTASVATNKDATNFGTTALGLLYINTCLTNTWLGIDTNWDNLANWSCGTVPATTTDVTIPVVGSALYPLIGSAASCKNLTIAAGASLTISGSNSLTVTANFNNSGTFTANAGILTVGGNLTNGTFNANTGTVILNGVAQTVSATPTVIFNNLTLAGTGAATFGAGTVTTNGILSIENGIVNTFSGSFNYGPSATLQYNTAVVRTASTEWQTFTGTGGVQITGSGIISLNNAKTVGSTAVNSNVPLHIYPGATLATAGFGLTFAGDFINEGTLSAGSSPISFAGITTAQNIAAFTTTGNVSMVKTAGTATLTGNISGLGLVINGTGGTLDLGTGLTHTFSTWTRSAGTLDGGASTLKLTAAVPITGSGDVFVANGGTIEFSGATQSVEGTSLGITYNDLTLSGTGTKTFSGSVAVANTLTILGAGTAKADLGTASHTAIALNLDGTIFTTGSYGGTGTSGTVNATYFAPNTGVVTLGAGACIPGTWNGSADGNWFNPLNWCNSTLPTSSVDVLISSTATSFPTIGAAGAVCRNITINSGASLTITGSNTLTISGDWNRVGTFNPGTGTVILNGIVQSISGGTTFNNLTLQGTGAVSFGSGTTTVNGTLSLENGIVNTFSGTVTYGAAGTLQYNTTSARVVSTEWPAIFTGTGGVNLAGTGVITLNAAKTLGVNTNVPLNIAAGATLSTSASNFGLTLNGNFFKSGALSAGSSAITIAGTTASQSVAGFTTTGVVSMTKTGGTATFAGNVTGGAFTLNGLAGTLDLGAGLTHTFSGIWTRSNGTLLGNSSILNIGGTTVNTAGTFTPGTGTVNYNGAGAQTIATVTYNNLILSGSGAKTTTGATVNGILSMEGTATTTGTVATYGGSSTLQYKGSAAQTTGVEFPATFSGAGGIIINNAAGVILATANKTVGANLNLTAGVLNAVTFSISPATVSRGTGWVNGSLILPVATGAQSKTFDIGDATNYIPLSISFTNVTTGGTLSAKTVAGIHPNYGTSTLSNTKYVGRYWNFVSGGGLIFNTGAESATIALNWLAGDVLGGASFGSLIPAKFNSPNWSFPSYSNRAATSLNVVGLTVLGDIAIGEVLGTQGSGIITATGPGTFVVPVGVNSIDVYAWGGGGAGGGRLMNNFYGGGGGGGGGFQKVTLAVTPGQTYSYYIGKGGIGNSVTAGTAGDSTIFSGNGVTGNLVTIKATGGKGGGLGKIPLYGVGGAGGTGTYTGATPPVTGPVVHTGGLGATSFGGTHTGSGIGTGAGGGGGAGDLGDGGNGQGGPTPVGGAGGAGSIAGYAGGGGSGSTNGTTPGFPGSSPGGGGGGVSDIIMAYQTAGGTGGNGQIAITWSCVGAVAGTVGLTTPLNVCQGSGILGTFTSTLLANGNYTITYTLSGANTGSNTVTLTMLNGTGTFTSAPLLNTGVTTMSIASVNCSSVAVTQATFTVNQAATPTFTVAPGASSCTNTNVIYTTQAAQSGYVWTIPGTSGVDYTVVSGGTGTNSLTVQWLTTGIDTVSVNYTSFAFGCPAVSPAKAGTIVYTIPQAAGPITGTSAVCQGATSVKYKIPVAFGATGYTWSYTGTGLGLTNPIITTGDSIVVNFSNTATSGNLTVYGTSSCGNGTASAAFPVSVSALPAAAGPITGPTVLCQGDSSFYSIPVIPGVSGYRWHYSGKGVTISDSTIVNPKIKFSLSATSGHLTVYGFNTCGSGTVADDSITVNKVPIAGFTAVPISINSGTTVQFTDTTKFVPTSWTWTFPGGTPSTSTVQNPSVVYATPGIYDVTLVAGNGCGNSTKTIFGYIRVNYPTNGEPGDYTFTVPAGVFSIKVQVWGGGGAGGSGGAGDAAKAGGGGGASTWQEISVIPGQTFNYHVGAGGSPSGTAAVIPSAADASYFGNTVFAGGSAGSLVYGAPGAYATLGAGGAGGSASLCIPIANAFKGGNGGNNGGTTGGGGGGSAGSGSAGGNGAFPTAGLAGSYTGVLYAGADGGIGGTVNNIGVTGQRPGGGGGGKGSTGSLSGSGAGGQVYITWPCVVVDVSNFSIATTTVCNTGPETVTVHSGTIPDGSYIVYYGLSGANTTAHNYIPATMIFAGGTGTFNTATLANAGSTSILVTGVGCTNVYVGNTSTFSVNPTPTITGTLTACEGTSTQLTGSGTKALSNGWVSASPLIATVDNNGLVSALSFGTALITYTELNGCSVSATINVTSVPKINTAATTAAVCKSNVAQTTTLDYTIISDSPQTYSIVWDGTPPNSFVDITDAAIPVSPITITVPANTPAGSYTGKITVKNLNGCGSSQNAFTVLVNSAPTVVTVDQTACAPGTVNLTLPGVTAGSTPGLTFTYWTDSLATMVYNYPTAAVDGVYYIKGSSGLGCYDIKRDTVKINPQPTIAISTNAACTFDLTHYTVGVTVSSGTVTSSSGTAVNSSGNIWSITNIPAGKNDTIIVHAPITLCTDTIIVTAPNCSCPVIDAPVSGGDKPYCAGSKIPTMTATVGVGQTIDWYDGGSGGIILRADSIGFTPTAAGTYYAEARIAVSGCTSSSRTAIVLTMNALPVANISYGGLPLCPVGIATVIHNGQAGGTYSSTPGLSINSTTGSINLAASTVGKYSVIYSFTNGTCSTTAQDSVTIKALPAATISYSALPYCSVGTASVVLTGQTGGTFSSTIGLSINGTTGDINLAASTAGNYTITYSFTDGVCQNTTTAAITINSPPTITGPVTVCKNATIQLTGSGTAATTTPWQSGTTSVATIDDLGVVTGVAAGQTIITYTDINGCTNTAIITVLALPVVTVSSNSPVCDTGTLNLIGGPNGMTSYAWAGPEGYISALQSPTISPVNVTEAGTYILTVSSGNGCSATDSTHVVVNPLPSFTITTIPTCAPDLQTYSMQVTVTSGSVTSTAGTVVNTSGNLWTISAIPKLTNITLTATDGTTSCVGTLAVTAPDCSCVALAAPVSGGDKEYCVGSAVATITASVGVGETVDWYSAAGVLLLSGNTSYTPSAGGAYYAEARNTTTNCKSSTRTLVNVIMEPLPVAAAGSNVAICIGGSTQLGAATVIGNTYSWSSSPGTFTSTLSNPVVSPTVTTTYTVVETVTSTGCSSSNSVTVTVNPLPTIAIATAPVCAVNLLSYSVSVLVNGGTVTSNFGTVANTSGNNWTVSAVPTGQNIIITVNNGTCSNTLTVIAPICNCPVIAAPVSGGNQQYCAGGTVPAITATVLAGETVDWYSAAGGTLLLSGNTSYTPSLAGTYFAQARNIASGCLSSTFTSVTVTLNPLPVATIAYAGSPYCATGSAAVTQTGQTGGTYSGPAGLSINPTTGAINLVASTPATYTVTYSFTNGTCPNTATTSITINALPAVSPITGTFTVLAGVSTQLADATPGGVWSSNSANATVSATGLVTGASVGQATITYSVTNGNNCTVAVSQLITVSAGGVLTIAVKPVHKTYGSVLTGGQVDSSYVTVTGLVGSDVITGVTLSYAAGVAGGAVATSPVNTYTGSVTVTSYVGTFTPSNYSSPFPTFVNGNIVVDPAPLLITGNDTTKVVGEVLLGGPGSRAFKTSGLVNNETIGSVTMSYLPGGAVGAIATTYVNSATPSLPVGGTFTPGNYNISYSSGTVIVGKAGVLTILANKKDKIYGEVITGSARSTEFTAVGLKGTDRISSVTIDYVTVAGVNGADASAPVGTYKNAIKVSAPVGVDLLNYSSVVYIDGDLNVIPRKLTVTANTLSKDYGTVLGGSGTGSTAFTATGGLPGDIVNSVTISYVPVGGSGINGADATASAATYRGAVVISDPVINFNADNYNIVLNPGNIVVNPVPLTITASTKIKPYGTVIQSHSGAGSSEFTHSALKFNESISSVTIGYDQWPASAAAPATTYPGAVIPSSPIGLAGFKASNYIIDFRNGDIIINQGKVTITVENKSKCYDGLVYNGGYTVKTEGLAPGDALVGTLTFGGSGGPGTTQTQPGVYPITVGGQTSTKYEVNFVNGTLSINELPQALAGTSQAICAGSSINLGGSPLSGHTYSWTSVPAGFTSPVSNPSVQPNVTTTYTLVENVTATGCSARNSVTVTVKPTLLAIVGDPRTICIGASTTLGAAAVPGSVYNWTTSGLNGDVFVSSASNPTVTPTETKAYKLTENNPATGACEATHTVVVTVTGTPTPFITSSVNGPVCLNSDVTYTTEAGKFGYIWTHSGGTVTAGGSTSDNSITIKWNVGGAQNVSVTYSNGESCNVGIPAVASLNISTPPVAAGTIHGPVSICAPSNGSVYSVDPITNATSYVWTISSPGATIVGSSSTSSITVDYDATATAGTISVYGVNDCSSGASSSVTFDLTQKPGNAGPITGEPTFVLGSSGIYSVSPIEHATDYTWTVPAGVTVEKGVTPNIVTLHFGPAAVAGALFVAGKNDCSSGGQSEVINLTVPAKSSIVYPVPNRGTFTAKITFPEETTFSIKIIDPLGKVVREILNAKTSQGVFSEEIVLDSVSSGFYVVLFYNSKFRVQHKIQVHP